MTLEEAIEFCLHIKEEQYESAHNTIRGDYPEYEAAPHFRLASEYKQLAEWLMELKELISLKTDYVFFKTEAKKLLKAAMEDMYNSVNDVHCKYCSKWHTDQCQGTSHLDCYVEDKFKWRYADEALALIGEEGDAK